MLMGILKTHFFVDISSKGVGILKIQRTHAIDNEQGKHHFI